MTGNPHVGKVRAMLRLLTIIFIATLLGCGRDGVFQRGAQPVQPDGDWFCEMAENTEDWACVQDPELARTPQPSRLPQPKAPPPAAEPVADSATDEPGIGESALLLAVAPAEEMLSEAPPPPSPELIEETPAYISLAYHPAEPTALVNLPGDYYAVQLIAMTSQERLEAYIQEHQLQGMSAARVERDGELYHVLILGIYETRQLAEQASENMPAPLNAGEPWIRELRVLQEAMIRGNTLAGGPQQGH